MKAYQCSMCKHLQDYEEKCDCQIGIDARPNHRQKGDAELCKKLLTVSTMKTIIKSRGTQNGN